MPAHGSKQLYVSGYTHAEIECGEAESTRGGIGGQPADAKLVTSTKPPRKRRDVYVYFDNDAKVHAPHNAKQLAADFGLNPIWADDPMES
ncbi:MAG: DUF72 domain-containing protein [Chthoniobacterales bacterium]